MKINCKIWVEDEESNYLFGYGIASILEAIDRTGTIRGASREQDRSYRYIWGRVRKAEEALGIELVQTRRGGAGSGAQLTDEGKKWTYAYLKMRKVLKKTAESEREKRFAEMTSP